MSEVMEDDVSAYKAALFGQNDTQTRVNSQENPKRPDSLTPSGVSMRSDASMLQPIELKATGSSDLQTQKNQKRPDSSAPSGVSMRSDTSMLQPIEFKAGGDGDLQIHENLKRTESPAPSCLSMKSDQSKRQSTEFKVAGGSDLQTQKNQKRPDSSAPSGVSMRSDTSMHQPIEFKAGGDGDLQIHEHLKRTESPAPSCLSMKSDQSKRQSNEFKVAGGSDLQTQKNQKRPDSSAPSRVSMRSDTSMHQPIEFKAGGDGDLQIFPHIDQKSSEHQIHLDSVFMVLEAEILTFVKNELKTFKKILSPESRGGPERLREDDDETAGEEEQRSSSRDAVLKITLDFLKEQKHEQLAESLQSKTRAMICQRKLKSTLRKKFQCLFEGIAQAGNPALLNQVYTELHITEGNSREVNAQHEVRQIEAASRKPQSPETTIRCEDIFKPLPGRDEPVRTLVTKGMAGIGKTVLTQKFTLNWAEGKANQDIQFIFPFTFRELNMLKAKNYSLVGLLHHIFTDIKDAGICSFKDFQVLFIFDGLDECRFPLDFHNNEILYNVTESTSVDVLLTNLIMGKLLPSARLWITTRPAAANQIPPKCVDMVTEVRGFTDLQKEEYFRKRSRDEEQASRIISHMKTSRSLHIMCHIPVFCWITATVLDHVLRIKEKAELPSTLTAMYVHFLLVQTKQSNVKYHRKAETYPVWNTETKQIILTLGKLAFEHLEKGHLIFYEAELKECGIDINAASVYSGVFTEIFKEERGLNQERVFCFVHLSIQEFLAALYVFLMFRNSGVDLLTRKRLSLRHVTRLQQLYRRAVDKALQSPNGHLDLFLRFLLGLSLDTNQTLLRGLFKNTTTKPQIKDVLVQYIKRKIRDSPFSERSINLFHCLNELNDHSLVEEIQQYLRPGSFSENKLTSSQWSALVFILLSSQKDLDVFDLKKFSASKEGLQWLLPVIKASRKSLLSSCNLSWRSCDVLAQALTSSNCNLRELDLSNNDLHDEGVKLLSEGLKNPECRLETLGLSGCLIKEEGCAFLASALSTNPSHLRELDLSFNHPGDSGLKLLSDGLQDPNWKLEILKIDHCGKIRLKPAPLRYFCELTLDPNTADRNLQLSTDNREAVVVQEKQQHPDHPERFDTWKQLLCSDRLTGRCYWEVQWRGRVRIGVSYRGIQRKGGGDECCIGWNRQSWSLFCSAQGFTAWHDNIPTDITTAPPSGSNRVAVYLDWPAGTVSFYCLPSIVSSIKLIHLHTFHCTFTEPLYAAFGFGRALEFGTDSMLLSSSVVLSQVEE